MNGEWLSVTEAARRLGLRTTTLYDWLSRSDYGLLEIRGTTVQIDYLQGGSRGQGRIRIAVREVERLLELQRVTSRSMPQRRTPKPVRNYPGIFVPLGRPNSR